MTDNVSEIDPVDPQVRVDIMHGLLETLVSLEEAMPGIDISEEKAELQQLLDKALDIKRRKEIAIKQNEGARG